MILQTLVRRRYLLTLVALMLSVVYSFPAFANAPLQLFKGNFFGFVTEPIVAHNSTQSSEPEQTVSLFQRLNLTDHQHQQLKQIHRQYGQKILKKKNIIDQLQQQLSDMMVGTEPVPLLRVKNQQLSVQRQEMSSLRFESMLATREILTPQQRLEFRKLVKIHLTK